MLRCMPPLWRCNRQVETLDRRHRSLQAVPDDVYRYSRSLEELLLDANQLRELPKELGNLRRLVCLDVSENKLEQLPGEISGLVALTDLLLSQNLLESIPDGQLKQLSILKHLPFALTSLNLKALWLAENQSQPMLKFQTEDDEKTGEKVLTCYLLPQQPSPSLENLLHNSVDESWTDTNLNRVSVIQFVDEPRTDDDEEEPEKREKRLSATSNRSEDSHVSSSTVSASGQEEEEAAAPAGQVPEAPRPGEAARASPEEGVRAEEVEQARREAAAAEDGTAGQEDELELGYSEPTVHFAEDTLVRGEDDEEEEGPFPVGKQRLIRKDTPHYKKHFRIAQLPRPEAVVALLQGLSSEEGVHEAAEPVAPEEEEAAEQAGWAEEEARNGLPGGPPSVKLTLVIVRQTGGLGISIAGGKGSTPYKGDDEVNGVRLHHAEHHAAVEALRGSGSSVSMTVLRERMVEPENAITVTPLRPEDDYSPRERREGLQFPEGPEGAAPAARRLSACLMRNERGLGFSIAGGKGSTPYRPGDTINGVDMTEARHDQAVALLTAASPTISLLVEREAASQPGEGDLPPGQRGGRVHSPPPPSLRESPHEEMPLPPRSPLPPRLEGQYPVEVISQGLASRSGLRVGDRILEVNGTDLRHATHQEAVSALLSNTQELRMVVSSTGAAARDGRLKVGLRILEVNHQSLLGMTHTEAVQILRAVGDTLLMLVCDGFDPKAVVAMEVSPGIIANPFAAGIGRKNSLESLSSIDRDFSPEELDILQKQCRPRQVYLQCSPVASQQVPFLGALHSPEQRSFRERQKYFEVELKQQPAEKLPKRVSLVGEDDLKKMKEEEGQTLLYASQ
ncbi:hypothetical protein EYD10_16110, partial [Varanus komodoensis]